MKKKTNHSDIQMFDDYYDKVRAIFDKDWDHKISGAPILKSNTQKANFTVVAYMRQMESVVQIVICHTQEKVPKNDPTQYHFSPKRHQFSLQMPHSK